METVPKTILAKWRAWRREDVSPGRSHLTYQVQYSSYLSVRRQQQKFFLTLECLTCTHRDRLRYLPMVQCVCVCVFSSHSFWTSSSLDVPAGVTQEEGHTRFLIHLSAVRALIFLSREGFSHSFPSSTVQYSTQYQQSFASTYLYMRTGKNLTGTPKNVQHASNSPYCIS